MCKSAAFFPVQPHAPSELGPDSHYYGDCYFTTTINSDYYSNNKYNDFQQTEFPRQQLIINGSRPPSPCGMHGSSSYATAISINDQDDDDDSSIHTISVSDDDEEFNYSSSELKTTGKIFWKESWPFYHHIHRAAVARDEFLNHHGFYGRHDLNLWTLQFRENKVEEEFREVMVRKASWRLFLFFVCLLFFNAHVFYTDYIVIQEEAVLLLPINILVAVTFAIELLFLWILSPWKIEEPNKRVQLWIRRSCAITFLIVTSLRAGVRHIIQAIPGSNFDFTLILWEITSIMVALGIFSFKESAILGLILIAVRTIIAGTAVDDPYLGQFILETFFYLGIHGAGLVGSYVTELPYRERFAMHHRIQKIHRTLLEYYPYMQLASSDIPSTATSSSSSSSVSLPFDSSRPPSIIRTASFASLESLLTEELDMMALASSSSNSPYESKRQPKKNRQENQGQGNAKFLPQAYLFLLDPKIANPMRNTWSCEFISEQVEEQIDYNTLLTSKQQSQISPSPLSSSNDNPNSISISIPPDNSFTKFKAKSTTSLTSAAASSLFQNLNIPRITISDADDYERENIDDLNHSRENSGGLRPIRSDDTLLILPNSTDPNYLSPLPNTNKPNGADKAANSLYSQLEIDSKTFQKLEKTKTILARFFGEDVRIKQIRMNRWTLQFADPIMEHIFHINSVCNRKQLVYKFTMGLIVLLVSLSFLSDYVIVKTFDEDLDPSKLKTFGLIRGVVLIYLLFFWSLSFSKRYFQGPIVEWIVNLFVMGVGAGLIVLNYCIAGLPYYITKIYFAFVLRSIVYVFSTVRLMYVRSVITGVMIVLMYCLIMLAMRTPEPNDFRNLWFMISFLVVGVHYTYSCERNRRRLFMLQHYVRILDTIQLQFQSFAKHA